MNSLLLQDWVSVANATSLPTVAQGAAGYLDVSEYQDLVFFLSAPQLPNPIQLLYQTSPTAKDSDFVTMLSLVAPAGVNSLQQANAILGSYSYVPPAKYVRWACFGTGGPSYQCTFRIWVAGYRIS